MKKISHKQLEACRISPKLWALNQTGSGGFYNFSYKQALSNSICVLHNTGDLGAAETKLEGFISDHFTDKKKIEKIREQLQAYSTWYSSNGIIAADSNVVIDYPLGALWRLGGFVSRIDVTNYGYRAILFEDFDASWGGQLRMPLIQLAVGQYLARPASDIAVGFQDLETNKTVEGSYLSTQLEAAFKEFNEIGAVVQAILPPS